MLTKIIAACAILAATVILSCTAEFPHYIKPCSQNKSNLNECIKTNGNLALQTLSNGDEKLNLSAFYCLKFFDTVTVKPLKHLPFSLVMKNGRAYGLENIRIKQAKMDLDQKHMEILYSSPQIIWQCRYEAQANTSFGSKVSRNSGAYNITFNNGEYLYQMDYVLKEVNGAQYIDIISHRVDFQTVEILHSLENIENNPLINGFWEETKPHFVTPEIRQVCSDCVTNVISPYFKMYPFNQIFTP